MHSINEDYVFVTLLNENPVLFPMEKVRAIYPNALHVERRIHPSGSLLLPIIDSKEKRQSGPISLFAAFYQEVQGKPLDDHKKRLFSEAYASILLDEEAAQ